VAQFVGSMFSGDSKFDAAKTNSFADFTELEKHGMALFFSDKTNCSRCHAGANFAADDSPGGEYGEPSVAGTANVGLDLVYDDQGKANGKFRIPSLRNIALTGPYMHDGRFNTLREVINHYNSNIQPHEFLDDNLTLNSSPKNMNFTELDMISLEAFLRTLTDEDLVTNEIYSNPFRK
jgi:cytochrome c peroxidase